MLVEFVKYNVIEWKRHEYGVYQDLLTVFVINYLVFIH